MTDTGSMRHKNHGGALGRSLLITAIYALVGYVWIIGSELVLASAHPESPEVFMISISKGLGFVTVTAILLFALVYTNLRKICREISVRKKSETALKEAQQLAHIGNFSFDAQANVFAFSDEAMRILDLSETRFPLGYETLLRHIHIDDRERVCTLAREAAQSEGGASFRCRVLRMNAPERTVQVQLRYAPQEEGGRPFVVGTLQDVTELIRAEAAARENEAIYKALINSSYDLVYLKDSSLRYITVNTNMQRYYGVSEDRLLGRTISEVKQTDESRLWEARDRSVLISGTPLYIEM